MRNKNLGDSRAGQGHTESKLVTSAKANIFKFSRVNLVKLWFKNRMKNWCCALDLLHDHSLEISTK